MNFIYNIYIFTQMIYKMNIDKKLYSEIKDYCRLNNLKISDYINNLLRKAFIIEKYGEKPIIFLNKEKVIPLGQLDKEPNSDTEILKNDITVASTEKSDSSKNQNIKKRILNKK